jgi:PncC family amidohydrolase
MEELVEISNYLKQAGKTLSIAESCTGGLISSYFTDISGASNFILKNFVTYAESAKVEFLGVSTKTLEEFGVISENVALEMAKGLVNKQGADFGISTTGILGPDDIEFKGKILPKGLVFIGVASKDKIKVFKYISKKETRVEVKKDIVETAIKFFNEFLKEIN